MLSPEEVSEVKKQLLQQISNLPDDQREKVSQQIESATPEQIEALVESKQGECLFCGLAKGTIETIKVYEDSFIIAFLDINPSFPGQTIVIPKEHYQFIFQMPDQVLWEMIRVSKMLMPIIVNVTKAKGISVFMAQGAAAGQRISHVSLNLIPRFDDDKAVFAWDRKEIEKKELESVGKEISAGVTKILQEERINIEKKLKEEPPTKEDSKPSKIEEPEEKLEKAYGMRP